MKRHNQLLRRPRRLPPLPQPPEGYMFYPGSPNLIVPADTIQRQCYDVMRYHDAMTPEERAFEHDPTPEDYDPPDPYDY